MFNMLVFSQLWYLHPTAIREIGCIAMKDKCGSSVLWSLSVVCTSLWTPLPSPLQQPFSAAVKVRKREMKWSESTPSIHMQNSPPRPFSVGRKIGCGSKYYRKFSRVKKFGCHLKVLVRGNKMSSKHNNWTFPSILMTRRHGSKLLLSTRPEFWLLLCKPIQSSMCCSFLVHFAKADIASLVSLSLLQPTHASPHGMVEW